jgi:hypothetical protein
VESFALRFWVRLLEPPLADAEVVQMVVLPAEQQLEHAMELVQRVLVGHAHEPPDRRLDPGDADAQLQRAGLGLSAAPGGDG